LSDGNFGNASTSVLFSKVAYQRKGWQKLISNFPGNEIESKCAEFKTPAVINKNFKLLKYERWADFFV